MLECMEILSIAAQKGINVYAVKGDGKDSQNKATYRCCYAAFTKLEISKRGIAGTISEFFYSNPCHRPRAPAAGAGRLLPVRYFAKVLAFVIGPERLAYRAVIDTG